MAFFFFYKKHYLEERFKAYEKKILKLYENYLIQRNRGKFKLIITREIKCCRRWRRVNSMRVLGYYEVSSLLINYKFLLYGFLPKK